MAKREVAKDCLYNKAARMRAQSVFLQFYPIWIADRFFEMLMKEAHLPSVWYRATEVTFYFAAIQWFLWLFRRAQRQSYQASGKLIDNLAIRSGEDLSAALHVGVSPGRKVQSYERDNSWDVGFLTVSDALHYRGDQASFDLAGSQIRRVQVRRPFGTLFQPRLFIQFDLPAKGGGELHWMIVEARIPGSSTNQYATLQRLRAQICLMPRRPAAPALGVPPLVLAQG